MVEAIADLKNVAIRVPVKRSALIMSYNVRVT